MKIEWIIAKQQIQYQDAIDAMNNRVEDIINGEKQQCVWLLEHSHIYTAGTSAKQEDLINPHKHPVVKTTRGGQYTYHGPGQQIAYTMINLKYHSQDVRLFVHNLEEWIIQTLKTFNIKGERRKNRIGVWTINTKTQKDEKIAAIGIRIKKWVAMHGIALNINTDLTQYDAINPCGIKEFKMTSLKEMGNNNNTLEIQQELKTQFNNIFGDTINSDRQKP